MTQKKAKKNANKESKKLGFPHYDNGGESRSVFLIGDIDEESSKTAVEKIIELAEKNSIAPIYLIISTCGGSIDDTMMLYDLMRFVKAPIITIGLGKIMSAGCLLLAAGEKGHRKMGKNARLMYHLGWDVNSGSVFEQKSALEEFQRQETQFDSLFAKEINKTLEEVEALYGKSGPTVDSYLTAEQCLENGIVDELI